MKKYIIPIFAAVLLLSCSKKDASSDVSYFNPLKSSPAGATNGLVTLLAQKAYRPNSPAAAAYNYAIEGRLQDASLGTLNANNLDAGDFEINGNKVTKTADNVWRDRNLVSGSGIFGANSSFAITGNSANSINPVSVNMYLPAEIELAAIGTNELSQTTGATFHWTADPSYGGEVHVKVTYKSTISRDSDPSLPANDITFFDAVPDSQGSYTLTPADLSGFPVGGILDVVLGRGVATTVNTGNHNVIIAGATITYSGFTLTL